MPNRLPSNFRRHAAFTLLETLAAVAIIAVLLAVMVPQVANFVATAQRESDKRTLTVLNDALNRYKTQGGDVNALTLGAPIANVIARLQTPINWNGMVHQVMKQGETYPAKSLISRGTGRTYRFIGYHGTSSESLFLDIDPTTAYVSNFSGIGPAALLDGSANTCKYKSLGSIIPSGTNFLAIDHYTLVQISNIGTRTTLNTAVGSYVANNIAWGPNGKIYGTGFNHVVFSIDPATNYSATIYAGTIASTGSNDGDKSVATFNRPIGLTFDSSGNMYVADSGNGKIRRIDTYGYVSTVASSLSSPVKPVFCSSLNCLYFIESQTGNIKQLSLSDNSIVTCASGLNFGLEQGNLLISESRGMLYISETYNHKIWKMPIGGTSLTLLAGTGNMGTTEGSALQANIEYPSGLAFDSSGNLLFGQSWPGTTHVMARKLQLP